MKEVKYFSLSAPKIQKVLDTCKSCYDSQNTYKYWITVQSVTAKFLQSLPQGLQEIIQLSTDANAILEKMKNLNIEKL